MKPKRKIFEIRLDIITLLKVLILNYFNEYILFTVRMTKSLKLHTKKI